MKKIVKAKLPESLKKFNIITDINDFKLQLEKTGVTGLALDIDETLSYTLKHWIYELSTRFGNPENLTVEEIIAKYRYAQDVPYWQTSDALEWMEEARESNDLQERLPLIENADNSVRKIHNVKPVIAYPTVRPLSVAEGTKRWLEKHNFPKAPIIPRPRGVKHPQGNKWKAKLLTLLYPQIEGVVDDNPGLIEYLPENYKGVVYLFNSEVAPNSKLEVISCKTWVDVVRKIHKRYKY